MPTKSANRPGFTLIELLVVIAVIALLIGIILPALAGARKAGRSAGCLSNLRQMAIGCLSYSNDNKEGVIPSFNMTGIDTTEPLDGWGPILDRDGYIGAPARNTRSVFYCPETVDVAGVASGQTGTDPNNPKGWHEWPFVRTGSANVPVTIPTLGFEKILRVSYWMNSINPIGGTVVVEQDLHYSGSVGYGPGSNGLYVKQTKLNAFVRPHQLIALADGVYVGRQRDNQLGQANSRIGYRHPGNGKAAANTGFADGHCRPLGGKEFPRAFGGSNDPNEVIAENSNGKPSVFANPERAMRP